MLCGLIGGAAWAGYRYFTEWRFIVSTDDAYVKADVSIIAAKVSGYIETVAVVENTRVEAGDLLAKIDDGDYRIGVRSAINKIATQDATIERLGRQAAAQKAAIAQAQAQVVMAQADALRASLAYDRALALSQNQYTTKANLDQARADKDRTAASVASSSAALETARANLGVAFAQQAEARRTKAELQNSLAQAERDLRFTSIRAPFDGVVGNRAAQPGQYVTSGTRLMALVPLQSAYVEANFKETQLGAIRPGQPVEISVDAYSGRTIRGTVESFAPASGQQFSLLPPENATGNFTKVVQRVPSVSGSTATPPGSAPCAPACPSPPRWTIAAGRSPDERDPRPPAGANGGRPRRAAHGNELQIGWAVFSTGIFQVCAIPLYTFLARRIDRRWLMMFGFACFTISMWTFTCITHDWGWRELLLPQAFRGFSQQFVVAPVVTLAPGSLAPSG